MIKLMIGLIIDKKGIFWTFFKGLKIVLTVTGTNGVNVFFKEFNGSI